MRFVAGGLHYDCAALPQRSEDHSSNPRGGGEPYLASVHSHNACPLRQTIGKMVTKVRVVDFRTEGGISWWQAWLRKGIPMVLSLGFLGWEVFLVLTGSLNPSGLANGEALTASKGFWLLMALPALWFFAEVLTMLTNEKRRALHDFIAGTVVVRTNTQEQVAQPEAAPNGGPTMPLAYSGVPKGPPSVS